MTEGSKHDSQEKRSSVYDWEDNIIVLSYTGGPEFGDLEGDAYGTARSPVEARLALFMLTEVSSLGVMVRKLRRGEDNKVQFDPAVFMPWTTVQEIDVLTIPGDGEEQEAAE